MPLELEKFEYLLLDFKFNKAKRIIFIDKNKPLENENNRFEEYELDDLGKDRWEWIQTIVNEQKDDNGTEYVANRIAVFMRVYYEQRK